MPTQFLNLNSIVSTLFSRHLDVHIYGVEISQAIQYFHSHLHLADPTQQGADNSVRLVANKPALLRVYLRAGLRSFGPARATVQVLRRSLLGNWNLVTALTVLPPGEMIAPIDPPYDIERGEMHQLPSPTIEGTLNFVVPAAVMFGNLLFRVSVSEGRSGGLLNQGPTDTRDVHVNIDLRQTLRLRAIMVGYSGPKSSSDPAPLFLAPPNYPADLLKTAGFSLMMYPVQSAMDYSSAGWVSCEHPLDDGPGCSPNWDALVAKLVAQKTADGNRSDVIYYGLLPINIPFRYPLDGIGCERSDISLGRVGGDVAPSIPSFGEHAMAHQVGHECGLLHAPGVSHFADADPNYPAYPPYDPIGVPKGSRGEYGVEIYSTVWILLPRAKDIMGSPGFSGDMGLSLYNYGRLMESPRLNPVYIDGIKATETRLVVGYGQDTKRLPMISLIGLMRAEGDLEITSVMRVETRDVPVAAQAGDLRAELRGEDGTPIAQSPLRIMTSRSDSAGCRCDGSTAIAFPCVVQALLPDAARGGSIAICDATRDLWVNLPRKTQLRIARFEASVDDNRLVATWNVNSAVAPEVWLQCSDDRGETWNALATGVAGDRAVFDGSDLPAGTVMFRLLASDGFDTAASDSVSVDMPVRPPTVSIIAPRDDETLQAAGVLRLWGAVTLDGRPAAEFDSARWLIDGNSVAEGLDVFVHAPPAGRHIVDLVVNTGHRQGRASCIFVIGTPSGDTERKAVR